MITATATDPTWCRVMRTPRPERSSLDGLVRRMPGKLMIDPALLPRVKEQYRYLAARLHHAHDGAGARRLMVASAMPSEGKTLTAVNIGLTLSESYRRRVIIIDADLRRPSMHEVFDLPNASGLNDALMLQATPPVFEISPRLSVMPAGRPNADPLGGLTSPALEALVTAASADYDWIVFDTPPVGVLTDANLMVGLVDAVVMVVAANTVGYQELQRAADALGRDRIIGVVLNRAAPAPFSSAYGYGYEYGYGPGGMKD